MDDKRVKLLFYDSFDQCLHCHSRYSYEVDREAKTGLFGILDMIREESNRVKTWDRMQSELPMTLVAITDHNDIRAYLGSSVEDIKIVLHKQELSARDVMDYYGLNKQERRKIEYQERFRIITGGEFSAKLGPLKVHTLGLDFDERILGLFRYTKKKYRFDADHRHSVKSVARAVHFAGGKFVLAHPARYAKNGITLNEVLEAAKAAKCFDGIECATSNTTVEQCFEILRFCATNNIPVTIGSDYHYEGRKSVEGMPGQRKDLFYIESMGLSTGTLLRMVVGKNVAQLNEIEQRLIKRRDGISR